MIKMVLEVVLDNLHWSDTVLVKFGFEAFFIGKTFMEGQRSEALSDSGQYAFEQLLGL